MFRDIFTWDIVDVEPFQDQLDRENELGSIFSEALENLSPSKKVREITKPVAQKLGQFFSQSSGPITGDYVDTTEQDKVNREVLFTKVVNRVNDRIRPALEQIDSYLYQTDAQTYATNAHNDKLKKDIFQKEVQRELKNIARNNLPPGHPVRMRIERI